MIDGKDREIVTIIQQNARIPAAEIARKVGMAASAVFERIKKLEEKGVIRGYSATIEPHALGLGLLAFIRVQSSGQCEGVGRALARIPGVQEVHHIAGDDDYLVKVRTAGPEALGRILREAFKAVPGLRGTRTTVVLETLKETTQLPIDPDDAASPGERPTAAEDGPAPRAASVDRQDKRR